MKNIITSTTTKKQITKYKHQIFIFQLTSSIFLITTILFLLLTLSNKSTYSHYTIIPPHSQIPVTPSIAVRHKIHSNSAAIYNGTANIKNSPYYPIINFYSSKVTPTLQILPHFQTYQQSIGYSCGDAATFMALRYLNITNITEYDLFIKAKTAPGKGTGTVELANAIIQLTNGAVDVEYQNGNDDISIEKFQEMVKECTNDKNKCVLLLENVEWGGHWMTLIGYDDMGTSYTGDDVLIFADPFDTVDHNQDGYVICAFERYYDMWFDDHILDEGHRYRQYVKIKGK